MAHVEAKGDDRYQVASHTTPGKSYTVDLATGRCDCPAGRRGQACVHLQDVMAFADEPEAAEVLQPSAGKKKPPTMLKLGYKLGTAASALQKEIRRGDVEAAVYWALLLYDKAQHYAWKRVMVTTAEDVGMADPEAVDRVNGLAQAWTLCRANAYWVSPQQLVMAVVVLCQAKKSTLINDLMEWTQERIKRGEKLPVLDEYLDPHTDEGKAQGKGWADWFRSRHVTLGVPTNEYTRRLFELHPEWQSEELKGPPQGDGIA